MKKFSSKLLAVILAVVLLAVPSLTLAASAEEYNHDCPNIYIHGIMASTIYVDPSDPDSEIAWPPSTDAILSTVKEAVPVLAKFSVTWNYDALAQEIVPIANNLLSSANCNPDGTPKDTTGVRFIYPEASKITKDSNLSFSYDWRLDPVVVAAQLDDFIDYVLEASGCDKVTIECHSLGGVITMSYISLYGSEKLRSVAMNTTGVYGETYTGELMNGQIDITADAVQEFLKYIMDGVDFEYLVNSAVKILNDAGLLDFVCKFGNTLVTRIADKVLPEVIVPMFGNWLSIWAMVPDEYLESGMDYVFNEIYKDNDTDFSALIAKINNYNDKVRSSKTETLLALNESVPLYIISRYGYSSLPITPSWQNLSDGVIDTKYSSMGATTSLYGETLTDEYLADKDEAYISPDKRIDASTCLFPEQTWFIKYLKHSETSDDLDNMVLKLLYSDGQATVNTYEEYPRYLFNEIETETISEDTVTEENLNIFAKLKLFFQDIKKIFTMLISLIFA